LEKLAPLMAILVFFGKIHYSLIWKIHFTQWAFGCKTRLSSKSYIFAILVISGSPHNGHFKFVSLFKILRFISSIASFEITSNS